MVAPAAQGGRGAASAAAAPLRRARAVAESGVGRRRVLLGAVVGVPGAVRVGLVGVVGVLYAVVWVVWALRVLRLAARGCTVLVRSMAALLAGAVVARVRVFAPVFLVLVPVMVRRPARCTGRRRRCARVAVVWRLAGRRRPAAPTRGRGRRVGTLAIALPR